MQTFVHLAPWPLPILFHLLLLLRFCVFGDIYAAAYGVHEGIFIWRMNNDDDHNDDGSRVAQYSSRTFCGIHNSHGNMFNRRFFISIFFRFSFSICILEWHDLAKDLLMGREYFFNGDRLPFNDIYTVTMII